MFQVLPSGLGRAAKRFRPGLSALVFNGPVAAGAPASIQVTSPAFGDGTKIPVRHTEDGAGMSPPIAWHGVPAGTRAMILFVEDADIPAPRPLVHALAVDLPPNDGMLAEGALPSHASQQRPGMGRNSYFMRTYLPMDSLPGHGRHHYAFQFFALDCVPHFHHAPGRAAALRAMDGHILAKGMLIGFYERD